MAITKTRHTKQRHVGLGSSRPPPDNAKMDTLSEEEKQRWLSEVAHEQKQEGHHDLHQQLVEEATQEL